MMAFKAANSSDRLPMPLSPLFAALLRYAFPRAYARGCMLSPLFAALESFVEVLVKNRLLQLSLIVPTIFWRMACKLKLLLFFSPLKIDNIKYS